MTVRVCFDFLRYVHFLMAFWDDCMLEFNDFENIRHELIVMVDRP